MRLFCHFQDMINRFFHFGYKGEQEVANCSMLIHQILLQT